VTMVDTRLVSAPRPTRLRYALGWRINRGLRIAIKALLVVAALVAVSPIVLVAFGYQPTLVRTDGMAPTLAEGDVIITESLPPAAVEVGDIITFTDAARGGEAFTERVLVVGEDEGAYAFATKGDAREQTHLWSTPEQARVTRIAYRVPGLGDPLDLAATPAARAVLLLGVAGVALVALVRRLSTT